MSCVPYPTSRLIESRSGNIQFSTYSMYDPVTRKKSFYNAQSQLIGYIVYTPYSQQSSRYFTNVGAEQTSQPLPGLTGLFRELSIRELWAGADAECNGNPRYAGFSDNIFDPSGDKRKPIAVGGTDPEIYPYDPVNEAAQNIEGLAEGLADIYQAETEEEIAALRMKVIGIVFLLLILIALSSIIWTL